MTDEFTHDLKAALGTRPVIEQAKGVLIALRGATADQAFAELQHVSQTHGSCSSAASVMRSMVSRSIVLGPAVIRASASRIAPRVQSAGA